MKRISKVPAIRCLRQGRSHRINVATKALIVLGIFTFSSSKVVAAQSSLILGHQIAQAQVVGNPSCGDILTSNTTLAGDLDCSSYSDGPALTLGADNISLDLGGYTIFGNSTGAATGQEGVSVIGFNGDIIKNGKILGGRSGVFLVGTTGTTISGVDLSGSGSSQRGSGVLFSFATNTGTTISNVTINNRLVGVNVQDISTPSLKIQSSNFNGDDLGIYFNSPATDLTLTDNTVSNGTNFSLLLASSATFLKVANNDFSNNNYGGISFVGTADLTITPAMFNVAGTVERALQLGGTNRMKIQDMNLSAVGSRSGGGILLASPNTDLTLTGLTITNRVYGISAQTEDPGLSFVHNNLFGNGLSLYGNNAFTLDNGSEGNYWGHSCPVLFTAGVDSSRSDIVDNYPYSAANAWLNGGIPGSAGCGQPFSFPAGGLFVVGNLANLSGGATVYFWGSQWLQNNPMTGGAGPNAFKGFEDGSSTPTCGGTWTSKPGNSSNPPATVPPLMGVIVSSSIAKSGSPISGNVKKIIVIQTNAGYGPAPGHVGTGKVVAVLCSVQ